MVATLVLGRIFAYVRLLEYSHTSVYWNAVADRLSDPSLYPHRVAVMGITDAEVQAIRRGVPVKVQSRMFHDLCAYVAQELRLDRWGWDRVDSVVETLVPSHRSRVQREG
jgi:hypothetical protein